MHVLLVRSAYWWFILEKGICYQLMNGVCLVEFLEAEPEIGILG